MYLRELFLREDDRSTAVFAFGRFNPPTIGHKKLLDKLQSMAQQVNGKAFLFLSQKQNNKTDPLTFKEKADYLKTLEPIATRKSSEKFLEIVSKLPNLIGGSADLAGSNNTKTKNHRTIKPNDFSGNYIFHNQINLFINSFLSEVIISNKDFWLFQ